MAHILYNCVLPIFVTKDPHIDFNGQMSTYFRPQSVFDSLNFCLSKLPSRSLQLNTVNVTFPLDCNKWLTCITFFLSSEKTSEIVQSWKVKTIRCELVWECSCLWSSLLCILCSIIVYFKNVFISLFSLADHPCIHPTVTQNIEWTCWGLCFLGIILL